MDTIKQTAEMVLNLAERENHIGIHFVWHGGEPLMLQPDYFYEAGEAIESVLGKGYFTESLQTSMIPYTSKWAPIVKERYASSIGTSVDFTQRKIKGNNENYLEFFLKRVEQARADGLYLTPGMVPTRHELGKGKAIVEWAIEHEFIELNMERYSSVGSTNSIDRPSNKQHSMFLIEVFDAVLSSLKTRGYAPYINTMVGAIMGIVFNNPYDRWGTKCQREFLVVEPNGSLNTCPDRAMHEKPFSNTKDGVEVFMKSERRNWIRVMDVTHKKDHCMGCENLSWCNSGCPITPNGRSEGEDDCSGFKFFLNHVRRTLEDKDNYELLLKYAEPLGDTVVAEKDIKDLFRR